MARTLSEPSGGEAERLRRARLAYAAKIRDLAGLRSQALVEGFARVPRERFLGSGPWRIQTSLSLGTYADASDPVALYDNVLVAIDAERRLNNGEPAALARWFDQLAIGPGVRFLHVGCGVGYYTAIAAHATGPGGEVVGVEVDPSLAARAAQNLAETPGVEIVAGDGVRDVGALGRFDAIFINAGATEVCRSWLEALRAGGRLIVPLTVGIPDVDAGAGHMLRIVRRADSWVARFVSTVGIFHCSNARSDEGEERLRAAFARGGTDRVRTLRREPHPLDPGCWLHAPDFCLTTRGPS